MNYKFITYPKELEQRGMSNDPFHIGSVDGINLREAIVEYISNFFDEVYPDAESLEADTSIQEAYEFLVHEMNGVPPEFSMANLKMVWGEIIFRVTGLHTSSEYHTLLSNNGSYVHS